MNRPRVGVGVWIEKDGRYLLGLRRNTEGAGTWCPPGGKVEYGESVEETARREVKEECGIALNDLTECGSCHSFSEASVHWVTIWFSASTVEEAENGEPDTFERWGWFSPEELPDDLFKPVRAYLKEYGSLPNP